MIAMNDFAKYFPYGFTKQEWLLIHQRAQGGSHREAAIPLGITEGSAKTLISRVTKKLAPRYSLGHNEVTVICERLSGCLRS